MAEPSLQTCLNIFFISYHTYLCRGLAAYKQRNRGLAQWWQQTQTQALDSMPRTEKRQKTKNKTKNKQYKVAAIQKLVKGWQYLTHCSVVPHTAQRIRQGSSLYRYAFRKAFGHLFNIEMMGNPLVDLALVLASRRQCSPTHFTQFGFQFVQ